MQNLEILFYGTIFGANLLLFCYWLYVLITDWNRK